MPKKNKEQDAANKSVSFKREIESSVLGGSFKDSPSTRRNSTSTLIEGMSLDPKSSEDNNQISPEPKSLEDNNKPTQTERTSPPRSPEKDTVATGKGLSRSATMVEPSGNKDDSFKVEKRNSLPSLPVKESSMFPKPDFSNLKELVDQLPNGKKIKMYELDDDQTLHTCFERALKQVLGEKLFKERIELVHIYTVTGLIKFVTGGNGEPTNGTRMQVGVLTDDDIKGGDNIGTEVNEKGETVESPTALANLANQPVPIINPCDILILDDQLGSGKIWGKIAATHLHALLPETQIIAYSQTYMDLGDGLEGRFPGSQGKLKKPVQKPELDNPSSDFFKFMKMVVDKIVAASPVPESKTPTAGSKEEVKEEAKEETNHRPGF